MARLVGSSSSSTDHSTPKPVLMKLAVMDAMGGRRLTLIKGKVKMRHKCYT